MWIQRCMQHLKGSVKTKWQQKNTVFTTKTKKQNILKEVYHAVKQVNIFFVILTTCEKVNPHWEKQRKNMNCTLYFLCTLCMCLESYVEERNEKLLEVISRRNHILTILVHVTSHVYILEVKFQFAISCANMNINIIMNIKHSHFDAAFVVVFVLVLLVLLLLLVLFCFLLFPWPELRCCVVQVAPVPTSCPHFPDQKHFFTQSNKFILHRSQQQQKNTFLEKWEVTSTNGTSTQHNNRKINTNTTQTTHQYTAVVREAYMRLVAHFQIQWAAPNNANIGTRITRAAMMGNMIEKKKKNRERERERTKRLQYI